MQGTRKCEKTSVENENGGLKRLQMKAPLVLSGSQSSAFEGTDWQRGVWSRASKAGRRVCGSAVP